MRHFCYPAGMPTKGTRTPSRAVGATLALLSLMSAAAMAQEGVAEGSLSPASTLLDATTNFFWQVPDRIWQCGRIQPLDGAFVASDTTPGGDWDRHFRTLHQHGVDVSVLQFHGFGSHDPDVSGQLVGNAEVGRNMEDALWLLHHDPVVAETDPFVAARPPFLIYYSIPIRSRYKSHRCLVQDPGQECLGAGLDAVTSYDFEDEWFRTQMTEDFRKIKNRLLLPHPDNVLRLRATDGNAVLDDAGLPVVPIALYLARRLVPNQALSDWVAEVRADFALDGLAVGFVLDTIFYDVQGSTDAEKLAFLAANGVQTKVHAEVVRAFGSSAVALTSFNPLAKLIGSHEGAETMRDWVPIFQRLYRKAKSRVEEEGLTVDIWPGILPQFDNVQRRKPTCEPPRNNQRAHRSSYLNTSAADWRAMLRMSRRVTFTRKTPLEIVPLRIIYDMELFEGVLLGPIALPPDGIARYPDKIGFDHLDGLAADQENDT